MFFDWLENKMKRPGVRYLCVICLLLFPTVPVMGTELKLDVPPGTTLRWDSQQARVGRFTIYEPDTPEKGCEYENGGRIVSVVGPIITAEATYSGYCEGAAHSFAITKFVTLDARTGKPSSLLEYFSESSLVEALNKDRVILKALNGKRARNLSDLFKRADGGCEMSIDKELLGAFAFHHLKGNLVAVRIGLPYGCEAMRGNFTELGVYLPIPATLRDWLQSAQSRRTLMNLMKK